MSRVGNCVVFCLALPASYALFRWPVHVGRAGVGCQWVPADPSSALPAHRASTVARVRQQLEVIAKALDDRDRLELQQTDSGARPGRQAQKKLGDVQDLLQKLRSEPRAPDDAEAVLADLAARAGVLEKRVQEKVYPPAYVSLLSVFLPPHMPVLSLFFFACLSCPLCATPAGRPPIANLSLRTLPLLSSIQGPTHFVETRSSAQQQHRRADSRCVLGRASACTALPVNLRCPYPQIRSRRHTSHLEAGLLKGTVLGTHLACALPSNRARPRAGGVGLNDCAAAGDHHQNV